VSEDVLLQGDKKNITRGGGGDADVVAGITRTIIDEYNVDTERVYLAGGSAGAFQTSATAASYPELYAAIGIIAGPGYGMAVTCAGYNDAVVPLYAQATVDQMGERARVMPFLTYAGTVDPLGEAGGGVAGCTKLAYLEWLYTNNLLVPGDGPLPAGVGGLLPAGDTGDTFQTDPSIETGQVPDGYAWTKHVARDRNGCEIGERWIVDGMGHTWGGDAGDVMGPSTSEALWGFFEQFTLSGGNVACAAG
jgi:poly(3-hydroxybutyrate) depolymerase